MCLRNIPGPADVAELHRTLDQPSMQLRVVDSDLGIEQLEGSQRQLAVAVVAPLDLLFRALRVLLGLLGVFLGLLGFFQARLARDGRSAGPSRFRTLWPARIDGLAPTQSLHQRILEGDLHARATSVSVDCPHLARTQDRCKAAGHKGRR